jgi:hypothetical protein
MGALTSWTDTYSRDIADAVSEPRRDGNHSRARGLPALGESLLHADTLHLSTVLS